MSPITKAIILTAGLGTRFLPMTKAVPKAMFPIGNKPVIQHLVEEAIQSGITEIMIVRSPAQEVIEEHFKHNPEYEAELEFKGKTEGLEKVRAIAAGANIQYAIQEHALGDGNALLQAKDFVGEDPFAVLFGDDIIHGDEPALKQMLSIYKGDPVICIEEVPMEKIHSYGVVDPANEGSEVQVKGLVEKPAQEDAPSNLGVIGKYLCSNEVMNYLETANAGLADGELRLIDAFKGMISDGKVLSALKVEGNRYDTGQPEGLLQANIALAKNTPQ